MVNKGFQEAWHAFNARPPRDVTQQAFDGNDKHLRRLAELRRGDRADAADLWEYTQDLLYTDIQGPLLQYLLPFCLEAWRDELQGTRSEYGGFVEHFYPLLASKHVFENCLTSSQTAAVLQFMRESILQEIDAQRGLSYKGSGARPYRWVRALTTHGVLFPDVEHLWTTWWLMNTVGRAVATVQYVACLMYADSENPVFAPWTPDRGGGPPPLWEFEGHLYNQRWLDANVRFLRQFLNPKMTADALTRAVERLTNEPEHQIAAEVEADLPLCADTLAARCAELPHLLETTQKPGKLLQWAKQ